MSKMAERTSENLPSETVLFGLFLALIYHRTTHRVLPVPLFGQSRKGYSRKAEVRSVLMSDNLIRKLPALESTDEFVRKYIKKAKAKETS